MPNENIFWNIDGIMKAGTIFFKFVILYLMPGK